jgi:hypothetical protein
MTSVNYILVTSSTKIVVSFFLMTDLNYLILLLVYFLYIKYMKQIDWSIFMH